MRTVALAILLTLTLARAATADEERAVRLTLTDGSVVEGTLLSYGEQTYRVQPEGGDAVEVAEADVLRVELLDRPRGRSPQQVVADVLRRARESGAIERVLGAHHFRGVEIRYDISDGHEQERREYLVRHEVQFVGGGIQLETEVYPAPGTEPGFMNMDSKLPYRWLFRLDAEGALVLGRAVSARTEITLTQADGKLLLQGLDRGRRGQRDWPWGPDMIPGPLLQFVITSLADQGLPPHLAYRTYGDAKPSPNRVSILRSLPGTEERDGRPVRTFSVHVRRYGQQKGGGITLEVDAELHRLLRSEEVSTGSSNGVSVLSKRIVMDRIDAEAFVEQRDAWGLSAPPYESEVVDKFAVLARESWDGGPWAAVLRQAREEGRLTRILGTRWFLGDVPAEPNVDAAQILVRLDGREQDQSLVLTQHVQLLGDPESTVFTATFTADGVLESLVQRKHTLDGVEAHEGSVEGLCLTTRTVTELAAIGDWPGSRSEASKSSSWDPSSAAGPVGFWFWPCVVDLADDADRVLVLHNEPGAMFGGTRTRLITLVVPADADELEVAKHAYLPVPGDLEPRPQQVTVVLRGTVDDDGNTAGLGEGRDCFRHLLGAVWVDGDGKLIATNEGPDVEEEYLEGEGFKKNSRVKAWKTRWQPVTVAEAERLQADVEAGAGGRQRRAAVGGAYAAIRLLDLAGAQSAFQEGDKDFDGQPNFAGSLGALREAGLATDPMGRGQRGGYRFEVRAQGGDRWLGVGWPLEPGTTGDAVYLIDAAGEVFAMDALGAFPEDVKIPAEARPWRR